SWLGLDDIIGQIRGRYQIYDRNMYEMELSKCEAENALFRLVAKRGGSPATSKEVYSVTKKMQDIYQQQREERVDLWKDISRLKVSLPETIQQYLSAYRKMAILDEVKGE
ncbi:MAG: hypothetical protein Q7T18_05420, partial [Sedimentisphaerales bacterium]|nr:hypothetical protein [Sedimentisphaerales bacterium]